MTDRNNYEEHEYVLETLVSEALDDPQTCWLSDSSGADLDYDEHNRRLTFLGEGAIDLSHLASIIQRLMEEARNERKDESND